jgi:hypothetical protein
MLALANVESMPETSYMRRRATQPRTPFGFDDSWIEAQGTLVKRVCVQERLLIALVSFYWCVAATRL